MAVTGKAAEHAVAAVAVDQLENGAIRIGFPQEFFVHYSILASVMAHVKAAGRLATHDAQKVCSCVGRGEPGRNRERGVDVRAEALVIPHLLLLLLR